VREPAQTSCKALGAFALALGLAAPGVLGRGDHGRTTAVYLDDQDGSVVVKGLCGTEKRFGLSADSVNHA
jgi:hypothetical protein